MLNANVEITHNRLVTHENRTSMMAKAIMPALKDRKFQINKTNERLASQYRMMSSAHNRYNLLFRQTHETQMIHYFALLLFKNYLTIQVGSLQRIHIQYNRYEAALDDTLIGIENLNSGYLRHHILDPQVLSKYLETIKDNLEDTAPEYEPVFTNVYQYYGNSLASFTNTIDDLLLQLPILIKLKVQIPMSLFSIEMVPIPLEAETYLGDKREYTQIIPETEYIALTDNNYVPLTQAQISLCAKIGYTYNRSELCECSLTAGNYLLSETDTNCRDMAEARDGYFTTYYAFNKIILDVITVKFNIQVDDRMITQSTFLHDDIS